MSKQAANLGTARLDEVGRCNLYLQATYSGTDVDERMVVARRMDIRREMLFHADGRTAAADVARQGQQLLHRDKVTLLVTGNLGCHFKVYLVLAGDDTHKVTRLVAVQHQCLEYLFDVLAQAGCHMDAAQVVLVYFIRNQFVCYLVFVQQPCCIGLCYLLFCQAHRLSQAV